MHAVATISEFPDRAVVRIVDAAGRLVAEHEAPTIARAVARAVAACGGEDLLLDVEFADARDDEAPRAEAEGSSRTSAGSRRISMTG